MFSSMKKDIRGGEGNHFHRHNEHYITVYLRTALFSLSLSLSHLSPQSELVS